MLVLALLTCRSGYAQAPPKPANTVPSYLIGNWKGTQYNEQGLYPQAFVFNLTAAGEFLMGNAQAGYAARGRFSFSNNVIRGSYVLTSSGEQIAFTGNYDAATQTLTCTQGMGGSVTNQGKWIARRESAPPPPPPPPRTNTAPPPPPPPTTTANDPAAFFLTSAKVTVLTGDDDKEWPTEIGFRLFRTPPMPAQKNDPVWNCFAYPTYTEALPARSTREFTLLRDALRDDLVSLQSIQSTGLTLAIDYRIRNNWTFWKISTIWIELEFKDRSGKPHPIFGYKKLMFAEPVRMQIQSGNLECILDRFLMPQRTAFAPNGGHIQ